MKIQKYLLLILILSSCLKDTNYLNLSRTELDRKIFNGMNVDDLTKSLGEPYSDSKINNQRALTYMNSIKKDNGNYDYPISVTIFISNNKVNDRLYHVY